MTSVRMIFLFVAGFTLGAWALFGIGATQPQTAQPQAGAAGQSAGGGGNPQDIARSAQKGSLKNPYQDFMRMKATRNSCLRAAMVAMAAAAVAAWVRR
jgi:hypothetical protein